MDVNRHVLFEMYVEGPIVEIGGDTSYEYASAKASANHTLTKYSRAELGPITGLSADLRLVDTLSILAQATKPVRPSRSSSEPRFYDPGP